LLGKLRPFITENLSPARLARHGLLDPIAVGSLLTRYDAGEKGLASLIWSLVSFQMWWDLYHPGVAV
jgi:hypothetical protein